MDELAKLRAEVARLKTDNEHWREECVTLQRERDDAELRAANCEFMLRAHEAVIERLRRTSGEG